MSHKATTWLFSLDPGILGASEFRVLAHLCDCHNPAQGCFPTQEYLRVNSAVSNGTVNNVLNALEQKGLIRRHQGRDGRTRRQLPTRYILGFEMAEAQEPTPKSGDGNTAETGATRLQSAGDGAVSNSGGEPSPKNRKSRLQPTGEKPVREPVNNPRGAGEADILTFWEGKILNGGHVPASALSVRQVAALLERGRISPEDLRKAGIAAG